MKGEGSEVVCWRQALEEQVWSGARLNLQHPDPSHTHLGCWALKGTMNARDLQGHRVHFADGDRQEQGGVNTCPSARG